jgi:5-(carboxyamino)imidazole ribonucleotide synthase
MTPENSKLQSKPLPSGATIGILGGGQLGRMSAIAAACLGYKTVIFTPEKDSPASQVCHKTIVADYLDKEALSDFANLCDVITIEFENIPVESLQFLENKVIVRPSSNVLYITQHRLREKTFLNKHNYPIVPFMEIFDKASLSAVKETMIFPVVLKTAGFGYDGKGQRIVKQASDLEHAWKELGSGACVVEQFIDLKTEISVVTARSISGQIKSFCATENKHVNHILDTTLAPAQIASTITEQARKVAENITQALEIEGLLCTEFFIDKNGKLYVNELAPRPHNSGHFSMDACTTSQFEQHIRAVAGLELNETNMHKPACMVNLLGDLWQTCEPDFSSLAGIEDVHLHLYGKTEARPGRKMGHINALADTIDHAEEKARQARDLLTKILCLLAVFWLTAFHNGSLCLAAEKGKKLLAIVGFDPPTNIETDDSIGFRIRSGATDAPLMKSLRSLNEELNIAVYKDLEALYPGKILSRQDISQVDYENTLTISTKAAPSYYANFAKQHSCPYLLTGTINDIKFEGGYLRGDLYRLTCSATLIDGATGNRIWRSTPITVKERYKTSGNAQLLDYFQGKLIPEAAHTLSKKISEELSKREKTSK